MNRNITATILIVLAAGIYFTVTQGAWDSAQQVKKVNDQYLSTIASAQQLVQRRDKVLQDYNNVSQIDRDRLDKMLPSTVDNIRLIIDLNSIAVQHGLSLKSIRAAAAPESQAPRVSPVPVQSNDPDAPQISGISIPTLDTVDVSFSVTAPYQQFISFMQDLEANLRIMDIKHLSLSVGGDGTYSYQVQLTTYWLRQ